MHACSRHSRGTTGPATSASCRTRWRRSRSACRRGDASASTTFRQTSAAREPSSCYLGRSGLDAARREFEASYVREALTRAGGRSSLAARDLGLTRQGLSKLVRRLGLDEEEAGSRLP